MNTTTALGLLLALTLFFPSTARADDPKAEELFAQAKIHFEKNEVAEAEALARQACETASTRPTQMSCLLLLGRVHQVKTGDLKMARWCFNQVILLGGDLKKEQFRERLLKAQAMLGMGNLIYAEREGNKEALMLAVGKFQAGHKSYPTPDTAEIVAQLMYRLAQINDRTPGARKKQLETCLKLCEEVFRRLKREPRNDLRAKAQIQKVLALRAMGQEVESELAWRKVDQRHLATNSLYQQALLMAVKGNDADKVAEKVKTFMKATRPTIRARNQFRKFVRHEPDFQGFKKKKSWRWIMKDEPPPLEEEEYGYPKLKTPMGGTSTGNGGNPKPAAKTGPAPVAAKTTAATGTAQQPAIALPSAAPPPAPPQQAKTDSTVGIAVLILAALLLSATVVLRFNKT